MKELKTPQDHFLYATKNVEVTEDMASAFIQDLSNSKEHREDMQANLNKLRRSKKQFPNAKMYINRMGNVSHWMD